PGAGAPAGPALHARMGRRRDGRGHARILGRIAARPGREPRPDTPPPRPHTASPRGRAPDVVPVATRTHRQVRDDHRFGAGHPALRPQRAGGVRGDDGGGTLVRTPSPALRSGEGRRDARAVGGAGASGALRALLAGPPRRLIAERPKPPRAVRSLA